jgi:hypothetical protein
MKYPVANTIHFILITEVPQGHSVMYGRFICTIRPKNLEPNLSRLSVGGNLVDYPGNISTRTADLTTFKIVFNRVILMPNAKAISADIKNFCLNMPLDHPEYRKLPITLIPDEIIEARV